MTYDSRTGVDNDWCLRARHDADPFSSIYFVSGELRDAGVCPLSWKGSSLCSDRTSCGLLFEGCGYFRRQSRTAGMDQCGRRPISPPMEK